MRPLETRYRGIAFSNRLEARYAVLFGALGTEWSRRPSGGFHISSKDGGPALAWVSRTEPGAAVLDQLALECAAAGLRGLVFYRVPRKGHSSVYVIHPAGNLVEASFDTAVWALGTDGPAWDAAVRKALSARFEFSENPCRRKAGENHG